MGQDTRFWTEDFQRTQREAIRKALEMFVQTHEQQCDHGSCVYSLEECYRAARAALDMRLR